jgi:NAD+ diphosphatase
MLHLIFHNYQILVRLNPDTQQIDLPDLTDTAVIRELLVDSHNLDGVLVSSLSLNQANSHPKLQLISLRQALNHFDLKITEQISYHHQLLNYYASHRYCGTCGAPTTRNAKNKFVSCTNCKIELYPKIAPSVIVRIHKDDSILMARGKDFPPEVWGLVAGFVEVGETLEQAVHREVFEEVGIRIHNVHYLTSQSWPFPNSSIIVGFSADYLSGEVTPDKEEIEAAGFFNRENIPGQPRLSYSISSKMIADFLNDKHK